VAAQSIWRSAPIPVGGQKVRVSLSLTVLTAAASDERM
jgi:hypothetical protein